MRAGVERLVHCSTTAIYGHRVRTAPIHEGTPPRPESHYAQSKALAEEAVRSHTGDRLPLTIARITTVLGPRSRSWIDLFRSIAAHRLRMIGPGNTHQHPADVSDIVEDFCCVGP